MSRVAERVARALEPRAEVLEAYLFRSSAAGMAQARRDVDVAVYVDPARAGEASPHGHVAELGSVLMAALGRNDVDVVVLNHAPPLLYQRVLRDGVRVLSRDLRATAAREGYALSRYPEAKP